MDPKCGDVKCNRLSKLLLNVCRGLGDPGSALNQQLMLANRFTRISQYFSESGEVEYYSTYSPVMTV